MTTTARGAIARIPGEPWSSRISRSRIPGRTRCWCASWHRASVTPIWASRTAPTELRLPLPLGHEGAGIIEAVGPSVDPSRVGEHVILAWRAPCGECRFCADGPTQPVRRQPQRRKAMRAGRQEAQPGAGHRHVLHATRWCTLSRPSRSIRRLPKPQMSLIGCGVMTGVGAALYHAGVKPGTSVAVFGCGGVGDSVIQGARLAGATTIIAVDVDRAEAGVGQEVRRDSPVNASKGDAVAADQGADRRQRRQLLVRSGRHTGDDGTGALVPGPGRNLRDDRRAWSRPDARSRPAAVLRHGRRRSVSWYGDCLPTRDFPLLADWYQQGRLNLDECRHAD